MHVYYSLCTSLRPCPDGFVLGCLKPHHAPLVVEHWPKPGHVHGWPKQRSYYEGLISNFESRALYSVDDLNSPVSWCLQYGYGSVGGFFSLESYRNKTLGLFTFVELCKAVVAQGFTPWSVVRVWDTRVRNMTAKYGGCESKHTLKWSALGL